MTVLIIDDDPDFTGFLRNCLLNRKLEVVVAPGGAEGIELLRNMQPDLIFLDLNMPKVDGIEVLKFLKSEKHTSKVIITSGYVEEYQQKHPILLAQVEILHKPFEMQQLDRILEQ